MCKYAVSLMLFGVLACATQPVAERTGSVDWRFKGLDQLDAAKTEALGKGGLVLVGLSGELKGLSWSFQAKLPTEL